MSYPKCKTCKWFEPDNDMWRVNGWMGNVTGGWCSLEINVVRKTIHTGCSQHTPLSESKDV